MPAGLAQWRFRAHAQPTGGSSCCGGGQTLLSLPTSKPRQLQPCQGLPGFPALSGLCPAPQQSISPSRRLGAAPASPGSRGRAHLAPRAPRPCALVTASPRAQLAARSRPETLEWSGLSSAQRTTLSNCFPFYSQAGSWESPSVPFQPSRGGEGAGGEGRRCGLHLARSPVRPERQARADASSAGGPRSSAPGSPEPRDGVSIPAPRASLPAPLPHVAMATEAQAEPAGSPSRMGV